MRPFIEYLKQFARFQRNARLYLISNILSGVSAGIITILYNLYLYSLGYRADFIGLILFFITIGAGVAIFPAGIIIDRVSHKALLIWSSVLLGAIGMGQFLFRQPAPLLIMALLAGIAGAVILVVNAPFLTVNSHPDERPHLFSINIVLGLVTTVLGELIGGLLPSWFRSIPWLMTSVPTPFNWLLASQAESRSYQCALLFAGIIAVPSFIPLFLLEDRGHPQKEVRPTANKIRLHISSTWFTPVFLLQMLRTPFFALILMQVLVGLGAGIFIPYFNIYFVKHLGATPALFGFIDGGANTVNALFTLAAPLLVRRVGKVNTILLTRLVSIPLLLIIGLTPALPLAAALYLFRQGFMDMSVGVLQVFSMEVVSEQRRGLANSGFQASFQVAWAITAPLGGLMIVKFGYIPNFLIGAFFYLLSLLTLWNRFGRNREAENGEQEQVTQSKEPSGISSEEILHP